VRAFLENFAKRQIPITYHELAKALQILPPHSIPFHQVTEAMERLMEEVAAADRPCPFIAALVISKARGGLPASARVVRLRPTYLGRFAGDPDGQDACCRAERRLRSLGRFARQLDCLTCHFED
jgi:hypothetical protein